MLNDIDLIAREIPPDSIRAAAAGINMAVAVTTDQFVIGRAGLCGLGSEVRRYPLSTLTAVRLLRDSHGDLLALEFGGTHRRAVLFPKQARRTAETLVSLLKCPVKKVLQVGVTRPPRRGYAAAA